MNRTVPRLVSPHGHPPPHPPTHPLPLPARHRYPGRSRRQMVGEVAVTVAAAIALIPLALAVCAVPVLAVLLVVMLVVGLVAGIVHPLAFVAVAAIPVAGALVVHTLNRTDGPDEGDPVTTPLARRGVCPRCGNHGWVCENHTDRPWYELADTEPCCGGAGALCPDCTHRTTQPS